MKFLEKVVISSLVLCVVYAVVAIVFQALTGSELSSTLTERWYTVFGIELLSTAVITTAKTIANKTNIINKIELMKQNGIMPEREDFSDSVDGAYYDSSDEYMG